MAKLQLPYSLAPSWLLYSHFLQFHTVHAGGASGSSSRLSTLVTGFSKALKEESQWHFTQVQGCTVSVFRSGGCDAGGLAECGWCFHAHHVVG